jgi:hypothetical protein
VLVDLLRRGPTSLERADREARRPDGKRRRVALEERGVFVRLTVFLTRGERGGGDGALRPWEQDRFAVKRGGRQQLSRGSSRRDGRGVLVVRAGGGGYNGVRLDPYRTSGRAEIVVCNHRGESGRSAGCCVARGGRGGGREGCESLELASRDGMGRERSKSGVGTVVVGTGEGERARFGQGQAGEMRVGGGRMLLVVVVSELGQSGCRVTDGRLSGTKGSWEKGVRGILSREPSKVGRTLRFSISLYL